MQTAKDEHESQKAERCTQMHAHSSKKRCDNTNKRKKTTTRQRSGTRKAKKHHNKKKMEELWERAKLAINLTNHSPLKESDAPDRTHLVKNVFERVISDLKKQRMKQPKLVSDQSDDTIKKNAKWVSALPLKDYDRMLDLVPRIVNVVTLAEAVPVPNSGVTLPLDLRKIACKCTNAFYSPRRFAAVQLAYDTPRCRVLVFHTGCVCARIYVFCMCMRRTQTHTHIARAHKVCKRRLDRCCRRLVGTGTSGVMASRLAIARAARQLATEVGIYIHVRNFSVINIVGAASINATLDCDAFARSHSASSHFDRQSFVGLAWRPASEPCCCEVYSTGRANLPGEILMRDAQRCNNTTTIRCRESDPFFVRNTGSTRERDLIASFSRMVPELLRHSNRKAFVEELPDHLRNAHFPELHERCDMLRSDSMHGHSNHGVELLDGSAATTSTSGLMSSLVSSSSSRMPPSLWDAEGAFEDEKDCYSAAADVNTLMSYDVTDADLELIDF
jgi:TATA-box binding protein (TBP) (component of TFIID and TFIIIB)